MLSPQALTIFYSICGMIVIGLLFRMWRKNRNSGQTPFVSKRKSTVQKPPTTPVVGSREPRGSERVAEPLMAAKTSRSPTAAVVPQMAIESRTAASRPVVRYASVNESKAPSWENRRLLEASGMLPTNTNAMPRVLPEDVPGIDDSDRTFGSWLNPAFAALVPESEERRETARKDLMAAGFYGPHALENLAAVRYVLMMMGLIFFGALLLLVPPQLEPFVVACCILAPLLGWALPALYIRSKAKERLHQIERAMPDLLDMLNMCVGQGLTVPASLHRIGRDFRPVHPALSQELSIVNEQGRISTMQTALENFSRRIDLPEVHSLTSLLIQTERMGTSISQALTTYSDTMRESQRQQADEKGNRATFRLLFPTVLCLMPAVYLFLLGPAINELQRFFHGGGFDALNNGSQAIQRMNNSRRGQDPSTLAARTGQQ